MNHKRGYKSIPLGFNRRMVAASASVTKTKNTIHSLTEVDINEPRRLMQEHFERTGEKLSLTAYVVTCLGRVIQENPGFNSFIKGRRLIILDDVNISVLIERDIAGEKVPEPIGIQKAQSKTFLQIHREIREAKQNQAGELGSLSGLSWIRLIPTFLLKVFVRMADKNIAMAKRYGKVAVTAVGMMGREPAWFIPHGSATVLVTVGGITRKAIEIDDTVIFKEHLCLTCSFDHDIIDGAPASRFVHRLAETIENGEILKNEIGKKD